MSELKTLKDIPRPTFPLHGSRLQAHAHDNYVKDLKEAAKEWVQGLKDSLAEGPAEVHIMKRDAEIEWIKHFFDLEEGDKCPE
jgi:hypothetical protein